MRVRGLAVSLLMFACGGRLAAQGVAQSTPSPRGDWLIGGSVGVPGAGNYAAPELFTIGVHWTQSRRGRLGADFSIGTMPLLFANGVGVLGLRAGTALSLAPVPRLLVLPSAGFSIIGGAGEGGGGAAAGLNAGVAAVVFGVERTGLRAGMTWHRFQETRAALWLVEVGFVTVPNRW